MKNAWITQSEKMILDSPFMKVIQLESKSSENGSMHRFFLFRSRNWGNIIPVTQDGSVVLVRQYRVGVSDQTLEVPGGVVDEGDTNAMHGAIRELAEETGYTPLEGAKCISLGATRPNPAIQDNFCYNFIIGPVRKTLPQKLDPGEMIETLEVPISEVIQMIQDGQIDHALILTGFFKLLLTAPDAVSMLVRKLEAFRTV